MYSGHHQPMLKDLFEVATRQLEATNLIEGAFLAEIITGETQELAYLWLATNYQAVHKCMLQLRT